MVMKDTSQHSNPVRDKQHHINYSDKNKMNIKALSTNKV